MNEEDLENKRYTMEIAQLLSRFLFNNHTISNDACASIGIGIYPLVAMINHSCEPNCIQVFNGKILEIR